MLEDDPGDVAQLRAVRSRRSRSGDELLPDACEKSGTREKERRAAARDVAFHDLPRRREELHGLWSGWTNRYGIPSRCAMQPIPGAETGNRSLPHGAIAGAVWRHRLRGYLVIPFMLSRAPLLVQSAFTISTHEVIDLVPILIDQPFDVLAARASLRTRVRDCTAKSHVVADEIGACRILERLLHVSLLHLEVTVDIASVVRLVAFRHLMMLRLVWSVCTGANWRVAIDYRANHRPAELSLDQQHQISATLPETLR